MASPQGCEGNDNVGVRMSTAPLKSAIKQEKQQEKLALSPIEEETDSPDTSGDSGSNYGDIGNKHSTRRKYPYDHNRVAFRDNYDEQALFELEVEETPGDDERRSPPFLTARNTSDHVGKYYNCDSSSAATTTSNERNSEEVDGREVSSSADGSITSGDVEDDYYVEDRDGNDPAVDVLENDDLENDTIGHAERSDENFLVSSRKKVKTNRRPKSAPSRSIRRLETSVSSTMRDDKFISDIAATLDSLETRIVKSERDIFDLRKELSAERMRGRKLARRCEDDRKVTRESLRIDLELWIKKLNDGLKGYLADWQKRERLRLNEEISRISDLYSQEIVKGLRISLKEWQTEDAKNILEIIERRERSRAENEKANSKLSYEKIQAHLKILEKRNGKSYAALCKQIDKWEDRLRGEIVKLHEDGLKKLRQQISSWYEDGRKKDEDSRFNCEKNNGDRCGGIKRSNSFLGAEALLQMEENLLKRLRDSSTKDLRRTEQIVRAELKMQRREVAKRMNDKIGELWLAFEEFGGCSTNPFDRGRTRWRNDHDECHGGPIIGHRSKDATSRPEVFGARRIGRKIVRSNQPGGSSLSISNIDEDGDRDHGEDDDDDENDENDTAGESYEIDHKNIPPSPAPRESNFMSDGNAFASLLKDRSEK